ncbi:hypothetical protein QE152_g6453 [Popillia japonica]|uniref:Dysbindin n=1 Tax=Popillia japonica TaxID=7064 RepID=A0AAW1MIU0_POPJA
MLNTLKGLLNAGKEILNEGKVIVNAEKPKRNVQESDMGADILSHFQQSWADIHSLSEENAKNASTVADQINIMHMKISNDYRNLAQAVHVLTIAPCLKTQVDNCAVQVTSIHNSFEKVEQSLLTLEDLIEKIELEQRKVEHRHKFALYKEEKLVNLEKARVVLSSKHAQDVVKHELKQKKMLEERQQVFEEAFRKDIETYKSLGEIPKIEINNSQPSALLEDMQIDFDKKELDQFLKDA